jgi:hypothetical protein
MDSMSVDRAVFALLGVTLLQAPALAQESGPEPVNTSASLSAGVYDDATGAETMDAPRREEHGQNHPAGTYTGVVPGTSAPAAAVVPANKAAPATITWPGFQMRADGTSRVFIQSTTSLAVQPSAAPGKYQVYLPGAHVHGGTNRLPLETRFFNTPVTKVSLNAAKDGVTVTLDLRSDVTPQVSNEHGSDGYYFIYIDLPKGHYIAAPAQSKPEPTAAATMPLKKEPPAPPAPTHLDESGSRASAKASGHAAVSSNIDNEKPPILKGGGSGHIKLGK